MTQLILFQDFLKQNEGVNGEKAVIGTRSTVHKDASLYNLNRDRQKGPGLSVKNFVKL